MLTIRYLPALYDPSTGTLTIHPSTPLYLMTHRVKRLMAGPSAPAAPSSNPYDIYKQRKTNLGEAFGTRKAVSQIRAEERNRVDVSAMESVKGHLMNTIAKKAAPSGTSALRICLVREILKLTINQKSSRHPRVYLLQISPLPILWMFTLARRLYRMMNMRLYQ